MSFRCRQTLIEFVRTNCPRYLPAPALALFEIKLCQQNRMTLPAAVYYIFVAQTSIVESLQTAASVCSTRFDRPLNS